MYTYVCIVCAYVSIARVCARVSNWSEHYPSVCTSPLCMRKTYIYIYLCMTYVYVDMTPVCAHFKCLRALHQRKHITCQDLCAQGIHVACSAHHCLHRKLSRISFNLPVLYTLPRKDSSVLYTASNNLHNDLSIL